MAPKHRIRLFTPVIMSLAGGASAAEFVANHLFVVDRATNAIRELDAAGNVVRIFGSGVFLDPQSIAFGPDGLLYVLDDRASEPSFDRVFVFSPEGDTLAQHAIGPEISFDAAGATLIVAGRGRFLVSDSIGAEIHDYVPDSGILDSFSSDSLTDAARLALGPAGRFYAATGGDPTNVLEFEIGGEVIDTSTAAATGTTPPPPLIVRDGTGRIVRLDRPASGTSGLLTVAFPGDTPPTPLVLSGGPFVDLVCGPDGRYWILAEDGAALIRVERDLSVAEELPYLPALDGAAIAFAPFRFRATVAGKRIVAGAKTKSKEEKPVFLTLFPGAGIGYLEFDDDVDDGADVASAFGPGAFAFAGNSYRSNDGETERFHAVFAERIGTVEIVAHARLRLLGKTVASSGYFTVDDLRGDLTLSRDTVAFEGKIESAKRLK